MKNDITVIIPVHELTDLTNKLLDKAIDSVVQQTEQPNELLIVGPENVCTYVFDNIIKNLTPAAKFNVKAVLNEGETDFASQVNLGVENTKTNWFTLLEFDDELASTWLSNVNKYRKFNPDVEVFLPIVVNVTSGDGFLGFNNEAVWAAQFSSELGFLDNTALTAYQGFNIDGMAMSKETYEAHGGLKPSMKLTFIYEFLLRVTYFSSKIMVIPKFGYKHMVNREGSLFSNYTNTLSKDEARWWMSLAKKEYFHTKDRQITYDKQSV